MRNKLLMLSLLAAGVLPVSATAQTRTEERRREPRVLSLTAADENRPRLGISTGPGGRRDTLGLLVTGVTRGSPAERAGIEDGDRLQSINGVSLRLSTADLDDEEMSGLATRRLIRELGKGKVGEEVELRVYREGQSRTLRVKTVGVDELEPRRVTAASTRRDWEERPTFGMSIGGSVSRRDTLGILVASVVDDGPADKARIEEGDRIASINGVDLRVASADAGDWSVSSSRMRRFNRELDKVKVGDEVELRLYRSGQARTVRVKSVARKELPARSGFSIGGDGFFFSDGDNTVNLAVPGGAGGVRVTPRLFDGRGFMGFDSRDDGSLQLRLAPERRAEIEGRIADLMKRFDGGSVIVRPRGRAQIIEDIDGPGDPPAPQARRSPAMARSTT
jgi:predicted metalloprotease with PDZ domain